MIRLAISVEGQTEEEFVKSVLAGHLRTVRVEATPILLGRARGGGSGGGSVNVEGLISDMVHLCRSFDAVTSLVDFYGFRGKGKRTVDELEEHLDQEIQQRVSGRSTVIPYVQKYEFEGLLFSDVTAFGTVLDAPARTISELKNIYSLFCTPEDINDNLSTAPSKRIKQIVPGYQKAVNGPHVTREIGLEKIRAECPRFNNWVTRLESLRCPS